MNNDRIECKKILVDNEAKIKLESEHEIIAFFKHDVSMISAKIDLNDAGFISTNYMPRELVIKL